MLPLNYELLPSKQNNIYPRTVKNIRAIFFHFFNFPITETHKYADEIYNLNQLELNQIEFVAKLVFKNMDFFIKRLKPISLTLKSIMEFGIDSLAQRTDMSNKNKTQIAILSDLTDLLNVKQKK